MSRRCFLKCLLDTHAPIKLPHNEETIIGRSKLTKIKDQSCSRQQLSLKANYNECTVEVKQLGLNPSGLDGFSMIKDGTYKVGHNSRIEILLNNYIHVIEFDPPPADNEITSNKRKLESDQSTPKKIKQRKLSDSMHKMNEASENIWEEVDKGDLFVFTSKGVRSSEKIAAFDMDGTLIKTKSGKVHPVDTNDWQISFGNVTQKLKEKLDEGYKLVVLTNQSPIGNGRVKIEDFKKKIENIQLELKVPIQVFIATTKGFYRKPSIGMWKYLTEKKNDGIEVNMSKSFYCGDAAGRVANWAPGKKKDHSLADKLLAENLNLTFYTPEQFFLGHSVTNVPMVKPEFNPREVLSEPFCDNLISNTQEVLVLVGYPGSGKSFIAKEVVKKSDQKYAIVCRDVLGTWQKCVAEATKLLKSGKSVLVDSTNPDIESRARWISLAKEMSVQCRCAKMTTSKAHSQHNNKFRELMKINHLPVNDIVFNTYKSKFVEPTLSEGFKEVINVNFNPCFDSSESEKMYKMYLLEK